MCGERGCVCVGGGGGGINVGTRKAQTNLRKCIKAAYLQWINQGNPALGRKKLDHISEGVRTCTKKLHLREKSKIKGNEERLSILDPPYMRILSSINIRSNSSNAVSYKRQEGTSRRNVAPKRGGEGRGRK